MTAPSIGCKGILVAAGIVADAAVTPTNDWACYIGKLPTTPAKALCLTDTGGLAPDPKWLLNFSTVSVLLRSSDYNSAYNKIRDVREALLGLPSPQTIGGDVWRGLIAIGDIAFVGYDEQERPLFSANYRLFIEPAAAAVENRQVM